MCSSNCWRYIKKNALSCTQTNCFNSSLRSLILGVASILTQTKVQVILHCLIHGRIVGTPNCFSSLCNRMQFTLQHKQVIQINEVTLIQWVESRTHHIWCPINDIEFFVLGIKYAFFNCIWLKFHDTGLTWETSQCIDSSFISSQLSQNLMKR